MKTSFRIILLVMLLTLVCGTVLCFADPYEVSGNYEEIVGDTAASQAELQDYINTKGGSFLEVVKTVAKWVFVIAFVFFAIKAVAGLFGNGEHFVMGLVGCILCCIAFFCTMYSTEILNFVSGYFVPDGEPVRTFYGS